MLGNLDEFQPQALAQAEEMFHAIASAESIIVSAIERECEALRTGSMLAAKALHTHLCDAARIYLGATRVARASIAMLEQVSPGICGRLEERRSAFASILKIELAVLATERAAASDARDFAPKAKAGENRPKSPPVARLVAVRDDAATPRPRRKAG
jgi:hypothetical protein